MATFKDSINSRPKGFYFVAGTVVAAVIYFTSSGTDYTARISQIRGELTKNREKLQKTLERTQNKAKFQEEMERVSQTFRLALEYLPKELDIQDLLKKIYSEARSSGVELTDFKPETAVTKDFFEELPMKIIVKGTYTQLVSFLARISKIPRIINIRGVDISTPTFSDGAPVMKMSGTLVGYRYKEGK